jgi:predicted ArsR family transcriptional regulator
LILAELKSYLKERGQASLQDLGFHFGVEPDAVRSMLAVWIRKGKVERSFLSSDCGGNCNRCAPETTELYRWRGDADD